MTLEPEGVGENLGYTILTPCLSCFICEKNGDNKSPSWVFSGQHLRNGYTGFAEIWATMLLLSPGTPKHSLLTTDT